MDQRAFGDPPERPVTVAAEKEIVLTVVRDEEIEITVVIVITPGASGRFAILETAGLDRLESLRTVVHAEAIAAPETRDQHVRVPVVVVVRAGDSQVFATGVDQVAGQDLSERTVTLIAELLSVLTISSGDKEIDVTIPIVVGPSAAM